ncbi:unnamed protein product [Lactuca virosa]|uniref:Uncharacterized protein n=1 Tax=Lactuca virosa TaxID=75947 RepID=A0AAU9NUZ1_9ASTR|nr:unnamed protein product [Lactuca virosa]
MSIVLTFSYFFFFPYMATYSLLPLHGYIFPSGHIDGTTVAPPKTKAPDATGVSTPNLEYLTWLEADQKAFLIIQASLTEVTMAETLGLTTAYDVWCSLPLDYRQDSQERMQNLKDNLR